MAEEFKKKPMGNAKSYGHIPHLPGSRMGTGDHKCNPGQAKIATVSIRDKYERVIVQEKLDGSNVGAVKLDGVIIPLTRTGYRANTSPYEQLQHFHNWVFQHQQRFVDLLDEGERVCGEWMAEAHGTRYTLKHEPFVAFDLMTGIKRTVFNVFKERVQRQGFIIPNTLSVGPAMSIEKAMELLKVSGHGAIDPVEGAVWRVERNELIPGSNSEREWKVIFVVKYVRPDKVDGCYLSQVSGQESIWNWRP